MDYDLVELQHFQLADECEMINVPLLQTHENMNFLHVDGDSYG